MNKKSSITNILGLILAILSVFIWGITFVSTKSLLDDFSALEILFIRFFLAYIALWCIKPQKLIVQKKDNFYFAMAGLTGITIYQLAENVAINFTTASNVSIIVSICPMFTAIIAQLFLKEKHINKNFIFGFIIAMLGIIFVSFNGRINLNLNPKGDFLSLTAAVCWGFYSLFVSLINKNNYDPICATRRSFFFSLIFMLPIIFAGNTFFDVTSSLYVNFNIEQNIIRFSKGINWLNLSFLGFLASAFCFSAWNKACDILGTVKTTVGIYLIPVVTIIFAFFTLGEKITLIGAIGALLTIIGLFISNKK